MDPAAPGRAVFGGQLLADDIDGRALFDAAAARRRALDEGRTDTGGVASLGDIVAVPSVREARDRGLLKVSPMLSGGRGAGGSSLSAAVARSSFRAMPSPGAVAFSTRSRSLVKLRSAP